jgi:CRISPR/Cas system CMR-associated protein Cmr5 small subunit
LLLTDAEKVNQRNDCELGNDLSHTDLERAADTTSETYREATVEALAYLHWLRRFAEAVLPEPEEGEE